MDAIWLFVGMLLCFALSGFCWWRWREERKEEEKGFVGITTLILLWSLPGGTFLVIGAILLGLLLKIYAGI